MDNYKEFQDKDLDECIRQAMQWFDCPRDNLEVEIVQDAKSGIFGIVGARKAKIRARRAHVRETLRDMLNNASSENNLNPQHEDDPPILSHARNGAQPEEIKEATEANGAPKSCTQQERGINAEAPADYGLEEDETEAGEFAPRPIETLDREKLERAALEVVGNLVGAIVGQEVAMRFETGRYKPRVIIDWKGDAGLIIGREGQTLLALQYLASRILSRIMGASLHLQLDVGAYRERQDDRLREMALALAERARRTGRPCSTRPLSSYHRRVIHISLQEAEDIQTRSMGDGALKRVLISPRRG